MKTIAEKFSARHTSAHSHSSRTHARGGEITEGEEKALARRSPPRRAEAANRNTRPLKVL